MEQGSRGGVVRMGVGAQDMAYGVQRDAGVLGRARGLGPAVEQERAGQRGGLGADRACGPGGLARGAGTEGVRPAVGGAGPEHPDHGSNLTGASKAARRETRLRARSIGVPTNRMSRNVKWARARSQMADVVT